MDADQPRGVLSDDGFPLSDRSDEEEDLQPDMVLDVAYRPGSAFIAVNFTGLPKKMLQTFWQRGHAFMKFVQSVYTEM